MKKRKYITFTLAFVVIAISFYAINIITKSGNSTDLYKQQTLGYKDVVNKRIIGRAQTYQVSQNPDLLIAKSYAFNPGGIIPIKYVCENIKGGENISIPIEWSNKISGTKSFALFMYDLNPFAKGFVHWAVINIPSNVNKIIEGASAKEYMPSASVELKNSSGSIGYTGPCPPAGTGMHEYKIIVYALNVETLGLSGFLSFNQFQTAIKGKVLAQAEFSGLFEQ
jgi:Raf kinase inhibitor-like YbhB/YbcL family protein